MGRLTKRAAMIAAVLGLVGCSGGGTAGTPPAASAAPVSLKLMDFSTEQTAFHKQVSDEYTRLYPNVTIQWVSIAQAQYEQTLPLAFQSKQAPDIFYWQKEGSNSMNWLMSNSWIGTVSPDGKVPSDWTKRWPAGSFQNGINMKNGKVYGFPWQDTQYWGPGYMYLNKAVFAQAGLDPNQAPTTWSQLADTYATIKSKTQAYCMAAPMNGNNCQLRAHPAAAEGKRCQRIEAHIGFCRGNFLKTQFASRAFAVSKNAETDRARQRIFKIGAPKGFPRSYPNPLPKCPAISNASAYTDASAV